MKASRSHRRIAVSQLTLLLALWLGGGACSTTPTVVQEEPALPSYAFLPHPKGYSVSDLRVLFTDSRAPSRESLNLCDADFRALQTRVVSAADRAKGVRDLISASPASYHWCFYSKLLDLEENVQGDSYLDEKRKLVLDSYEFLTPVARGFVDQFRDSRYLRWAIRDYSRLSEAYFFRRVDIPPQTSQLLIDLGEPYAGAVAPARGAADPGKLESRAHEADESPLPEDTTTAESVSGDAAVRAVSAVGEAAPGVAQDVDGSVGDSVGVVSGGVRESGDVGAAGGVSAPGDVSAVSGVSASGDVSAVSGVSASGDVSAVPEMAATGDAASNASATAVSGGDRKPASVPQDRIPQANQPGISQAQVPQVNQPGVPQSQTPRVKQQ